jgi:hypothetical protein
LAGRLLSQLDRMLALSATEQSALMLDGMEMTLGATAPSSVAADPLAVGRNDAATRASQMPQRRITMSRR